MGKQSSQRAYSQRQLRVGELVKQNLGELFIRNEAKIPSINSKLITVTEVRMTPDLKTARVYVIPLGGIDTKETVRILTEYSHLVRKALSKRLDIKFLPKLTFVEDNSFEYAEKIEKIIKKIKINDTEKKLKKGKGNMYVFDSAIEHRVTKLIKGDRYSFNAWPRLEKKKKTLL